MRFNEFKIIAERSETEAEREARRAGRGSGTVSAAPATAASAPATTNRKVYTVGDSHAEGLSYLKGVINRANGGQPSTSKTNYGGTHTINGKPVGLDNIPKDQIVIIAQGANDTANSARAVLDSKGKQKPVAPSKIASNVKAVVDAAKANGHIVVFVLFPNGNARAPGLAKYYSGDYQEEVRTAIKSAVGVPVVDLEGKGLSNDGIHATPSAYKSAAQEAIDIAKNSAPKDEKPPATSQSGQAAPKDNKPTATSSAGALAVPTNLWRSEETRAIQQALVDLGYNFPRSGVDGYFGPETAGVVRQFQKDNGLKVDGDPGPETVGALNKKLGSGAGRSVTPTPKGTAGSNKPPVRQSGRINPNPSRSVNGAANMVSKSEVSAYLKSKGMSDNHRIGILANIQGESDFNSAAIGDKGTAFGFFQHRLDREVKMKAWTGGGDSWRTNWKGQIDFGLQEPAGRRYLAAKFKRYEEAVEQWVRDFERPEKPWEDTVKRIQFAHEFAKTA